MIEFYFFVEMAYFFMERYLGFNDHQEIRRLFCWLIVSTAMVMAKCFSYSGFDHTTKSQFVHISLQSLDLLVYPSCNLGKKVIVHEE